MFEHIDLKRALDERQIDYNDEFDRILRDAELYIYSLIKASPKECKYSYKFTGPSKEYLNKLYNYILVNRSDTQLTVTLVDECDQTRYNPMHYIPAHILFSIGI